MKFFLIIFLVIIACQSCQYEPTGSNYVEVDPNFEPAQISLIIPGYEDTLWFNSTTTNMIHYELSGEINRLTGVIVYYDTTDNFYNSKLNKGSFYLKEIETDSIEYHTLDIVATTKSGTGSLADIVGAEGTIYHQHYVLAFFNLSMYEKDSLKFEEIDGKLKISFKPYLLKDFYAYRLDKTILGGSNFYPVCISEDVANTNLIDESYIGEPAEYRLYLIKKGGNMIHLTSGKKGVEMPVVSVKKLNRNEFEISWTKPKYLTNCIKYVINTSNINQTDTINDINTLTFKKKFPIGSKFDLAFNIWIKDYNGVVRSANYPVKVSIITGDPSFGYNYIESGTDNYIYFSDLKGGLGNYVLNQYDLITNQVVRSVRPDSRYSQMFSVSPNGKYILYFDGTNFVLTTPEDFTSGKKLAATTFPNETINSTFNSFTISDNGIGAVSSSTKKLYVYDFINDKFIAERDGEYFVKISSQGNYLLTTEHNTYNYYSKLYLIEYNNLKIIKNDFKINFSKFNPYIDNQLVYTFNDNSTLIFYDCSNGTEDRTYNLNSKHVRAIDFESGLFMISSNGYNYQIIDFNNSFTEVDNFVSENSGSIFMKRRVCYTSGSIKWEVGK